ncbi:hypothetical protein GYB22_13080 [bacterium]|nr:hypothetical protein [bacterium]
MKYIICLVFVGFALTSLGQDTTTVVDYTLNPSYKFSDTMKLALSSSYYKLEILSEDTRYMKLIHNDSSEVKFMVYSLKEIHETFDLETSETKCCKGEKDSCLFQCYAQDFAKIFANPPTSLLLVDFNSSSIEITQKFVKEGNDFFITTKLFFRGSEVFLFKYTGMLEDNDIQVNQLGSSWNIQVE